MKIDFELLISTRSSCFYRKQGIDEETIATGVGIRPAEVWGRAQILAQDPGGALYRRRVSGRARAPARSSGLDLSPATTKVLADLEELGFVASPHTSAGRIPTPVAIVSFVDTLLTVKQPRSRRDQQLEVNLHPTTRSASSARPRSFSPNSRISRASLVASKRKDTGLPSHRVSGTFGKARPADYRNTGR